jgi:hypothetical protein
MSATTTTTTAVNFALADVDDVQAPVTLASLGRSRATAFASAQALYFVSKPSTTSCPPLGIRVEEE